MNIKIILFTKLKIKFIYKFCIKMKSLRKISKKISKKIYKKFDKIYINLDKLINISFIKKTKYYIFLIDQIIFQI